MSNLVTEDFTLSFTSVARSCELDRTLRMVEGFPNIQVILNGANLAEYGEVIGKYHKNVRFIVNNRNLGIAAAWNEGLILSNTRYAILSSDDIVYPPGWFDPLLDMMNRKDAPLQASLSHPMSFSCFCIDKKLIALQGWFDHNFTMAYYEDEDWYLRFRERLGLYNTPTSYEQTIPLLKTVVRPPHKRTPWNPIPNEVYFLWKWQRLPKSEAGCLHSRELVPYRRRLKEPHWPLMEGARRAYSNDDFREKTWAYSPPRWEMRALTLVSNSHFLEWLRKVRRFS